MSDEIAIKGELVTNACCRFTVDRPVYEGKSYYFPSADIAKIVRYHHERVDGEGYPDRVRGDEIPLLSRIIAVADAYNAMTSDRPYRDALGRDAAARGRVLRARRRRAVEPDLHGLGPRRRRLRPGGRGATP